MLTIWLLSPKANNPKDYFKITCAKHKQNCSLVYYSFVEHIQGMDACSYIIHLSSTYIGAYIVLGTLHISAHSSVLLWCVIYQWAIEKLYLAHGYKPTSGEHKIRTKAVSLLISCSTIPPRSQDWVPGTCWWFKTEPHIILDLEGILIA